MGDDKVRKIITVTAAGFLLLMSSACGSSKPAATEASTTPAPTLAASAAPAITSPSAQPSVSIAPTPAPSASKEPSTAPTATATVTATVKPTTAPTVAPTAAPTATPKPAATPAPSVKAPEGNAKAEALFKANCMSCHGANLEGDFGPNLTKVGARLTKDKIAAQITNGGGDMPAQGKNVSAADIEVLAAWLAGMK
jgi:mono/diheme cytochrome c family protein